MPGCGVFNDLITTNFTADSALNILVKLVLCLQCFDTVGWVAGRASGL